MLPIVIAGATGRMGRVLLESTLAHPDCNLLGATVRPGSAWAGHSCASLVGPDAVDSPIVDSIAEFVLERPVVIDFTTPESTRALLGFCREHDMAMVIGDDWIVCRGRSLYGGVGTPHPNCVRPELQRGRQSCFGALKNHRQGAW